MMNGYLYSGSSFSLSGIPSGTYDVYLYGHGDQNSQKTVFSVKGAEKGTSTDASKWNSVSWNEGGQYVKYSNVDLSSGSLTVGVNGYVNGLQLVPVASGGGGTPTCTSFTYTCGDCMPSNTKTCTVATQSPTGCTGGSPVTTQSCTYVAPVRTINSLTSQEFYDYIFYFYLQRVPSLEESASSSYMRLLNQGVNRETVRSGFCENFNQFAPNCLKSTFEQWFITSPILPIRPGCSDWCPFGGAKQRVSETEMRTCGNYDADSCLEWSSPISCPDNYKVEVVNGIVDCVQFYVDPVSLSNGEYLRALYNFYTEREPSNVEFNVVAFTERVSIEGREIARRDFCLGALPERDARSLSRMTSTSCSDATPFNTWLSNPSRVIPNTALIITPTTPTLLVASWNFDSGLKDIANNIQLTPKGGAILFDSLGDKSISLNGNDQGFESPYFSIGDNKRASISLWINLEGFPQTEQRFFARSYADIISGNIWSLSLGVNQNGKVTYGIAGFDVVHHDCAVQSTCYGTGYYTSTLVGYDGVSTNSLVTNKWKHVVLAIEPGQQIKLYIDGVLQGLGSQLPEGFVMREDVQTKTYIGGWVQEPVGGLVRGGISESINGKIDNFQIYNKALDGGEVVDLYESQKRHNHIENFNAFSSVESILLQWIVGIRDLPPGSYINLSRGFDEADMKTIALLNPYENSYNDEALVPGVRYYYRIELMDSGGNVVGEFLYVDAVAGEKRALSVVQRLKIYLRRVGG